MHTLWSRRYRKRALCVFVLTVQVQVLVAQNAVKDWQHSSQTFSLAQLLPSTEKKDPNYLLADSPVPTRVTVMTKSRFPLKNWLSVDNVPSGPARYSIITLIFHRILLWSRRPTGQIRKNVLSMTLRKIAFRSSGKSPENLKRISDFEVGVGVGVARGCHVYKGPWVEWDHYHSNRPDFPW